MARLLIFAAGIVVGVLAAMKLTWSREPVEPAWREDDDGIQPIDPWVFGLSLDEVRRAIAVAEMFDPSWRRA